MTVPAFLRPALAGAAALFLLTACGDEKVEEAAPPPAYTRTDPAPDYTSVSERRQPPSVRFTDIAAEAGIEFAHETGAAGDKWMPETMGSGCAFLDYDGDGDDDILLVNSTRWEGRAPAAGSSPTSELYRNDGSESFAEVTAEAGLDFSVYGMGAAAADGDGDDDLDIYLTTLGPNLLLENRGGRFADRAAAAGVQGDLWEDEAGRSHPEWSTGAVWVDVDGDGWLDLFVTNYVRWSPDTDLFFSFDGENKSYATPQQYPGSTCRLYRNRGDGGFDEITGEAGVLLPHAKSMGVAVADFEEDGLPDLVVTNDTQPNFLLRNTGGRFEEIGLAVGIGYDESGRARAGMGVDVASLDNDGVATIGIGNFSREALSLYRRQTSTAFLDVAGRSRLVQPTLPTLTFGLRFFDYDLDGFQDLIIANGHIEPEINAVQKEIEYAQPPQLFWNDGEGILIEVSEQSGAVFQQPMVARGLAVGDIQNNGRPDVLMTENGGGARLLRNEGGSDSGAVCFRLRGRPPNREAIGARVALTAGGQRQQGMVRTGSSYLSQSSLVLTFGLGAASSVDSLRVRWPDGSEEVICEGVDPGFSYLVAQGEGIVERDRLAGE
ncbi:MAG: CRTAC1 family protein [Gemmatimonadetes bacterium]|nr:CRTAC1 family protein [Gemmatimonadota bacterium]